MPRTTSAIQHRLQQLEAHLQAENPVLLQVVQRFRQLDQVAYRMGLLESSESYATQIPWWPLIAVLGTFSAGKSSFINQYVGMPLQRSGNQAVDDKYTVVCYSNSSETRTLPGLALDSDPRFPFYKVSEKIEPIARGEGARIDAYLQLKTCPAEVLRGKILIDSPGFDADAQRTSTLKITEHIVNLSDLVLVFFDARHPEPGAMRDTLTHLVRNTIQRNDSEKFLYILNQIDTTAREDNPEEVVAAWQRALGECGLTAGRFYTIYNAAAASPIEDDILRARFEKRRDQDLGDIQDRMQQVEVERAYRIIGALEQTARSFSDTAVPALQDLLRRWRQRTLMADGIVFSSLLIGFIVFSWSDWQGLSYQAAWWQWLTATPLSSWLTGLGLAAGAFGLHLYLRQLAAKSLQRYARQLETRHQLKLVNALQRNTRFWRNLWRQQPVGWGKKHQRQVSTVLEQTDRFVQELNDRFTDPSGRSVSESAAAGN
jgi:GTPase SAR1 family protein